MSNNSTQRIPLPIHEVRQAIVAALRDCPRLIVQAPTGSGKSTQVPQMLLDDGVERGRVVILQPRRLPARMLAARVAWERDGRVGDEVGFQIRFQDASSRATRIKYVTEGILLRQMLSEPALPGIGTLIFDEFHERHLYGDVTLARALQLQKTRRPDLKLIVMSATLDSGTLARYLDPCRIVRSEGRTFPVGMEYLEKTPDPKKTPVWDVAVRELERRLPRHAEGDVLIFMPGAYEISRTVGALRNSPAGRGCVILPLHGELPPDQQDAAMNRYDRRKIIVSTNVAETSLTIDGVTLVVDSGLARMAKFDPNRGINTLLVEKISRASAEQRAGRAGRTRPGTCLRLWTQAEHATRSERETPEIRRVDLAEILLMLKAGGILSASEFPWFEPPEPRALERGEILLRDLGAADPGTGAITEMGRRLVAFPLHPRYARMLLAAGGEGCVPDVALIAALQQERNLLLSRQGEHIRDLRERRIGDSADSDFIALLNAWDYAARHEYDLDACRSVGIHAGAARQVGRLYDHFLGIARAEGLLTGREADQAPPPFDAVARCILLGFSDQVAVRLNMSSTRCELVHKRRGDLAKESSVTRSRLLVACEVREIEGRRTDVNVVLNLATAIKSEWLQALFPGDLTEGRSVFFDAGIKRVVLELQTLFRDLVLERKQTGQPTEHEAAVILAGEVVAGRLNLTAWDPLVEQWFVRVSLLAGVCPEIGVSPLTDEDRRGILEQVCAGAFSYKELKDRPVWPVLKNWFSPAQQAQIDRFAPERVDLVNGRNAKVHYEPGVPPYISLPIQSLYGVEETPKIAKGRVPLVVHILAPSQRPVQITQDMRNFWREHYPGIKKELQRKYPKHAWR